MNNERIWIYAIVVCFLSALGTIMHSRTLTENTVRTCLAKSVSPNLAGCMNR